MELNEALAKLNELQMKMYAYRTASSALYLDGVTVAPKETSAGRGVALGILAGEEHKLFSDPEVGKLLDFLKEKNAELDPVIARQVELLSRSYAQLSRIPMDEYVEYAQLTNDAGDAWHKAKETSDFQLFRPYLEKLVAFNIKFAGYYDSTKKPYDALLNEYERGVDMEYLDKFFGEVRSRLVPIIKKIAEQPQIDDSFLNKNYPVDVQRKFSDYLMEVMGLDRNHCTIGETEHPFTLNFNSRDVRITTNYSENSLADSLYSVVHEGGHALYELNVDPAYDYNCLSGGVSMGIHESQSRFYENIIGRSKAFAKAIFPKVKEFFPTQLEGVDADMFYRAINKSQPSLIRTEADELTYSFHVMIRYEIEKQLIGGTLEVKDVPSEWNRLYKEYLGVDVPDDKHGCLQDSHWSGGSFGYFPSYALGSAYGVQMLRKMEDEIDVWGAVEKGDLAPITAWLKEKVHKFGCLKDPADILKNAVGGEFDPKYYAEYLENKFSALYGF
ncbi:MAG: carboxypeptidase M32 [Clostridia bacterium]|nr:carboxypeptidase M32 [Clostridia bacterium]